MDDDGEKIRRFASKSRENANGKASAQDKKAAGHFSALMTFSIRFGKLMDWCGVAENGLNQESRVAAFRGWSVLSEA
jgi:hypothetical protein